MLLPVSCEDFDRAGMWSTDWCCATCHSESEAGLNFVNVYAAAANKHGVEPVHAVAEICCKHMDTAPTRTAVARAIKANRKHWQQDVDFDALERGELP
jgi:hypothetical protein